VIADGGLTELPDVQHAGRRLQAHDALWPVVAVCIGLDDLPIQVGLVDLGVVGFVPLSVFFRVLGWTSWAARRSLPMAILATGKPEGRVFRHGDGAFVPGAWAICTRWTGLEEVPALAHEDEDRSSGLSTLTGVLVGLDGDGFEEGLGIYVGRVRVMAVRAEPVVSIGRVLALGARFAHTHQCQSEGVFRLGCKINISQP
jgi:hypothetical protein